MSRMATNEYIGAKRRAYAQADRAKRKRILDEVCETTGYERKYANRLLTGNRKFRERKGRGKTYGDDVAAVLKKVWREAGCPCLPYFKAEVERWVEEYTTQVAHIKPDIREKILAMSDRTMSRLLSGEVRVKPGWAKGNKRSGRGACNEVKANTPCASDEVVMACNVPPGDAQIDTFALGGGDPSDNFFWILDGMDRKRRPRRVARGRYRKTGWRRLFVLTTRSRMGRRPLSYWTKFHGWATTTRCLQTRSESRGRIIGRTIIG